MVPDLGYPSNAEALHRLKRALLSLDQREARRLAEESRAALSGVEIVETLIAPALEQIGRAWEEGTVALSQVYMCGRLCEDLINTLVPERAGGDEATTRIAMATLDDYHLLGKRIVLSALRASGFAVRDFSRGSAAEIAARTRKEDVRILLVSTLMLPAALRVAELRELLSQHDPRVQLVVGGAPFRLDPHLGREVGADEVGTSTADAIAIVRRLTRGSA